MIEIFLSDPSFCQAIKEAGGKIENFTDSAAQRQEKLSKCIVTYSILFVIQSVTYLFLIFYLITIFQGNPIFNFILINFSGYPFFFTNFFLQKIFYYFSYLERVAAIKN